MSTDTPQSPPVHHYQHDPEKTALEQALSSGLHSVNPYINHIIIGVVAVAVVLAGWIYFSRTSSYVSTEGWAEFAEHQAPSDFKALAEKYPQAPVANWALLEAGRRYTNEGLQQSLNNRVASDESLSEARDAFQTLLDKGANIPGDLREEALFGMANCLEALSGENIGEAIDAYKTLITEFPETRHKKWAEARMEVLGKPLTEEFYVWFRKQNPSPQDRTLPSDLQFPFDHPALPPVPGATIEGTAPPFPTEGVTPPAAGTPENMPAEGTPAEGTPAEGTPAEGTPAEGTPAEGTPAEGTPPATPTEPAPPTEPAAENPAPATTPEPAPAVPATEEPSAPAAEPTAPATPAPAPEPTEQQ